MTLFELTTRLMSIPSVTGSEREVGEYLAAHLSTLGYRVERQRVEDNRFNVIAHAGDAQVVLCTHIDTVPPTLPIREDSHFIYGRGSCDAKGIIAAMLEAGERLRRDHINRFGYLFCVGEETGGEGAKAANTLEWNSKYVIVGEPTGNKMATAQKGTFTAIFTVKGKAAHSGYPEAGVSAIENLWRLLTDCRHADWGSDPLLGRGTFNIGVFNGGERANIVPAHATASIMIRTIEPRTAVLEKMREIVGNRATMEVVSAADPQMMHVVDGFPTTAVSFGSDIPYLGNLGKPLLIGPGSILDAHTADEKIGKQELLDGAAHYDSLVRKLL
ncbi:MAG: M20/M25/M40 family metallo-hydrolase [Acidobacteria bacterium]|nr:M20/M25/M40 family metallo-hydrolase [Acidobacteriota bacterium]